MKNAILLFFLFTVTFSAQSQDTINGKPPTAEQKKILKEANSDEEILTNTSKNACMCIDSIQLSGKDIKEKSAEVKKCIDKQILSYDVALELMKTLKMKKGDTMKVDINLGPNSVKYKKYYHQIESQLMNTCQSIQMLVSSYDKNDD